MYQLINNPFTNTVTVVKRLEDGACIPFDPDNTDYQAYLAWVAQGNKVDSAEGTTNLTSLNREAE